MKGARIAAVQDNTLAAELGLTKRDRLIRINNKELTDLIQFQFEWAGEEVLLEIEKESGERQIFEIEKEYDEQLGIIFEQAVFDGLKLCRNKCLFCFVDQMPPGMRESLYIKDDDYRLSFLQGSYITLTNLRKPDIERIKREHLSPLYVSVHTTDSGLRVKMLKNPAAAKVLEILRELSKAGIEFHTQVVLCPGINDGIYLEQTYHDLAAIEGVKSIAVVPVGVTAFRENLVKLKSVDREIACGLISWAKEKQKECLRVCGTSFIWLSDEIYLTAGIDPPAYEAYEDFPQLENGVGMVRLLWKEFAELQLPAKVSPEKKVVWVTGVSGEKAVWPIVRKLNCIDGMDIQLKVVSNRFFGPTVTVTGLLTGKCLLSGLKAIEPESKVIIPSVMIKTQEDRFLDDLTVKEVADTLKVRLQPVAVEAQQILAELLAPC